MHDQHIALKYLDIPISFGEGMVKTCESWIPPSSHLRLSNKKLWQSDTFTDVIYAL